MDDLLSLFHPAPRDFPGPPISLHGKDDPRTVEHFLVETIDWDTGKSDGNEIGGPSEESLEVEANFEVKGISSTKRKADQLSPGGNPAQKGLRSTILRASGTSKSFSIVITAKRRSATRLISSSTSLRLT